MDAAFIASYMGLAIWAWDWFSNFKAEYDLLWSRRLRDMRASQFLYFATRYSALVSLSAEIGFQHFRKNQQSPIAPDTCRKWLFFAIANIGWIFALLLSNLMLRVYALYWLDRRVIFAHTLLLILKVVNVLLCGFVFLPNQSFTSTCIPIIKRPLEMVFFTLIELAIQAIPVYLISSRGEKIERLTQARRTINLVAYLRREGMLSWSATLIFSMTILIIAVTTRNTVNVLLMAANPLFIIFFSSLGCQLTLYMRRSDGDITPTSPCSSAGGSLELDLFDSTWNIQSIDYGVEHPTSLETGDLGVSTTRGLPKIMGGCEAGIIAKESDISLTPTIITSNSPTDSPAIQGQRT